MSEINHFKNACRVCLTVPTSAQLSLLSANLEEKLGFIQGLLKNDKCHQVSKYICSKCEPELEGVHNFLIKLESSNFRIKHEDAGDEERDIHPVVKTEKAESENQLCGLENYYGQSPTEWIHDDEEQDINSVVKTEQAESENEHCELENDYGESATECIHDDQEHDIHPVVKTEEAESKKQLCELENDYGKSATECIHEMKIEEVPKLYCKYVAPVYSNCKQKKGKIKPRKELKTKICDICDKSFSNRSNLVRHLQDHQGKRFVCGYEDCNSAFTQKSTLKNHMVVHTGEKRFGCTVCNKKFTQQNSLVLHLKIHKNIKNYECDRCKRGFIQKQNLKRHLKGNCKADRVTKFQCTRCHNYFATKQSLLRHNKVHEVKSEVS